ncbi:MAG: tRNA lysidine(34) synthetase TilS [Phycisphaerae bacterium]|nr:tRNA lysidine(34) synthetase TilS [Planctomycetota bacterium]MBL7220534.1 tRNA lysidine(34) synthetase TilS [Phycisphaerae bacterium]
MKNSSAKTDPLVDEVAGFIDARNLIAPEGRLVVGVSGGCDSVAALAILRQLARCPRRAYQLTVAHLDHALRADSAGDAAFVAELAGRWDLPCIVERIDIAAIAAQRSLGIEEAGRMARYEFLQQTAERTGGRYVAVAHHADDNAETICHRIFRGSHLRGASGMPASRKLGEGETLLVRPLLNCRRSEIEAFCARMNLAWRTDPTNARSNFTRNFIRNELLPLIRRRINPNGDMALVRLGKALAEAEEFIAAQARDIASECIGLDRSGEIVVDASVLAGVHRGLGGWIFREAMERGGIALRKVSTGKLEELSALADGELHTVNLPGDYVARRRGDMIVIAPAIGPGVPTEEPVILSVPGETNLPSGATVVCSRAKFDCEAFEAHCADHRRGVELLDADRICGQLICRPRLPGDRFAPLGLSGSQTVSDFLTNAALDPDARDAARCICDEEGIVYLAPLRIDQRVKITPTTGRVMRIEVNGGPDPAGT